MNLKEWLPLLLGGGGVGGVIWKLAPVVQKRYFAEPGPSLALNSKNTSGNRNYPRLLDIENIGHKVALNITWEIRNYYPFLPPRYDSQRGGRMTPLKPSESFAIDVRSELAESADFCDFEIYLRYTGPNRAAFFSHFTVHADMKRNEPGLNRAQFALVRVGVWARRFWINLCIQARVRRAYRSGATHGRALKRENDPASRPAQR
jgi:hypothetical protein